MQDFPSAVSQLLDELPTFAASLFDLQEIQTSTAPAELAFADLSKEEPDLDDLDQLLAESLTIAKKNHNKRQYKELKKANEEKELCDFQLERWELLENISVWMQNKCKCGWHGSPTFLRNMQKLKKVGSSLLHWKEVEELPDGGKIRYALVTNDVGGCWDCRDMSISMLRFEDFKEVVG